MLNLDLDIRKATHPLYVARRWYWRLLMASGESVTLGDILQPDRHWKIERIWRVATVYIAGTTQPLDAVARVEIVNPYRRYAMVRLRNYVERGYPLAMPVHIVNMKTEAEIKRVHLTRYIEAYESVQRSRYFTSEHQARLMEMRCELHQLDDE